MMRLFRRQCLREFTIQIRQIRALMNAILFFLMIVVFFPLTLRPEFETLRALASGLVWTAMLLALLMSSDRLFDEDARIGYLEQWMVSGYPITLLIYAKLFVLWVLLMIPLLFICPIIGLFFHLSFGEIGVLMGALLLGTPTLLCLSAFAATFSLCLSQKSVWMGLIALPLSIPVMILGSGGLLAFQMGLPLGGYYAWLALFSLISLLSLPFAMAGIIRMGFSHF
jgi:heme exporter protein B